MPVLYHIFSTHKIAYIKAYGLCTAEEIVATDAAVLSDPAWRNGYHILCDYREIEQALATIEGIEKIVEQDSANAALQDRSRAAVVAPQNVIYGLSRMWELMSDEGGLTGAVFRTMKEAAEWLGVEDLETLWSSRPHPEKPTPAP